MAFDDVAVKNVARPLTPYLRADAEGQGSAMQQLEPDKFTNNSISTRHDPSPMSQQTQSPLFRLPAELRNEIYTYLLCPDALSPAQLAHQTKTKDLSVRGFNQTSTPTSTPLSPAILSTCQRIHIEAHPLLYTTPIFHAHPSLLTSLPHLHTPARPVLYPRVASQIRRWQISLRLDTDPRFSAQQAAAAFSGAEYLEIRVWQAQFEACDWSVLRLFVGVRGVRRARVGGSVDAELAAWLEGVMMGPLGQMCECGVDDERWLGRREELCGQCFRKVGGSCG
ncbi:hypothetical protein K491DRAFT_708263 [Lophiostoma macrostomum CBS 122681]|uniref:DUF7730 domain-containing protein n=1 Tax=Lophiostoma macrostomum CBS 122681 TaxID=1314788 RepID=A0A6A6SQL2_9PLEO|nr:hypothetical protein K491DRAFT_708263 [Lophiostoma macrostomum CBS 122681]